MEDCISTIPNEMLRLIFECLPQKGIGSVRLVCWKWLEVATPLYLHTATVALRKGPLGVLKTLCEHRLFKVGIKTLILDMTEYQGDLAADRQQYGNAIITELGTELANQIDGRQEKIGLIRTAFKWRNFSGLSEEDIARAMSHRSIRDNGKLDRKNFVVFSDSWIGNEEHTLHMMTFGWYQYKQMFEQQQEVLRDSTLMQLFSQALASFAGVRNLVFKNSAGPKSSISENGITDCSVRYCLQPRVDDSIRGPQLVDFFEAWSQAGRPLDLFTCSAANVFLPATQRALTASSMNVFRHTQWIGIAYGSDLVELILKKREHEACVIQSGYIRTLLSAATSVEQICIRGAVNIHLIPNPVTLYPILGDMFWANLKSLWLAHVELQFEELAAFCQRHLYTLTGLTVIASGLFGGIWADALPVIRGMKKLRKVMLEHVWHGKDRKNTIINEESAEAVKTYILQGGPNPLIAAQSPSKA